MGHSRVALRHKYTDDEYAMVRNAMNRRKNLRWGRIQVIAEHSQMVRLVRAFTSWGPAPHGHAIEDLGGQQTQSSDDVRNLFVVDGSCVRFRWRAN